MFVLETKPKIMKTELTKEEIKLLYKKLTWLNDNTEGATLKGIIGECLAVFKDDVEQPVTKFDDKPCKHFNGKVNGPGWSCRIYATRCNGIDCKERCTYWKSKGKKY